MHVCGALATVGVLAFVLPMSISAGRIYLLPITILLLPVMLLGALVACLFGPLATAFAMAGHYERSLHGEADERGVTIRNHKGKILSVIAWDGITKLVSINRPPIVEHELELCDGAIVELATLPSEGLQVLLDREGVEWIGGEWGIPYWEYDRDE